MMILREIAIGICQAVLFLIGISVPGLSAHLGGALIAWAFNIDEQIPSAVIFFAAAAVIGWIGNGIWPENWIYNPLL